MIIIITINIFNNDTINNNYIYNRNHNKMKIRISHEIRKYSGPKVLGQLRTFYEYSSSEQIFHFQYYSMYIGEVPKMMSSD